MRDTEFENIEGPKTQIKSKEDKEIDEQIDSIISSNQTAEVLLHSSEQELDEESPESDSEDELEPRQAEINLDFGQVSKKVKSVVGPAVSNLSRLSSNLGASLRYFIRPSPMRSNNNRAPAARGEEVTIQDGEGRQTAEIHIGRFLSPNSPLVPKLPSRDEKFAPRTEIQLDSKPLRIFLDLISVFGLIQKVLALIFFATACRDPYNYSRIESVVGLGFLVLAILPLVWNAVREAFKTNKVLSFIFFVIETVFMAKFYALGLLSANYVLVPVFLSNFAGNLALLHHSISKKALRSRGMLFTSFVIYVTGFMVATLSGAFRWLDGTIWLLLLIFGGFFSSFCSAKDVLILDERLREVNTPVQVGECAYYAMMLRYDSVKRQLLLVYSKLFSE